MPHCNHCGLEKPGDEFHKYGRKSLGGRYAGKPVNTCKDCRSVYMRDYAKTPEGKKRCRAAVDRRREKRSELIRQLKDNPCTACGGRFHPAAMDFHHRVPVASTGEKRVQWYACSHKKLLEEVAKCDLVCANCHRVITWAAKGGDAQVEKPIDAHE